jgi:hypothetical protein
MKADVLVGAHGPGNPLKSQNVIARTILAFYPPCRALILCFTFFSFAHHKMSTPSNASDTSSGSTGAPTFAQIPLPPGMTLEQYLTLQGQVGEIALLLHHLLFFVTISAPVTIAITVACAFAIILWD